MGALRPLAFGLVAALTVSVAAAHEETGYLPAGAIDSVRVVGPPPAAGSLEEAADIAAYKAALAGVGTPRWRQATADDDIGMGTVLNRYACALDARLEPASAPATVRLLTRSMADVDAAGKVAKDTFRRPRPFAADDPATPLCIEVPAERRAKTSTTYPSGHGTLGTVWGLILSEAAPDRAGPVAERSRSFIESRQVCRVHYPSDLHAGERLGAVVFARLQSSPEFQADLAAARAEIAAAPKPTGCG
jgi:acid phosphatase (class A)